MGNPIRIYTRSRLIAHRGRLLLSSSFLGVEVYAAAFLRKRQIILESALLATPETFRLILVHELFHFVWPRLSNRARAEFKQLLAAEWESGARGELGESSDLMKMRLREQGLASSSPRFQGYVCESFCDTAAAFYSELPAHSWFTLRGRWLTRRQNWFRSHSAKGPWKC